jgi:hypothetical protein
MAEAMKHFGIVFLAVLAVGCARGPRVPMEVPAQPRPGYYDVAWVEPSVVVSDSLFALIRADRIDSVFVESKKGRAPTAASVSSVAFEVDRSSCFVSVNVITENGSLLLPLVARNLPRGYYKLTINLNNVPRTGGSLSPYYLAARFCDSVLTAPLIGSR